MGRKYFGTDGVRGRVGELPITPEFVMHLGYSAGEMLMSRDWHLPKGERPVVLIGKDTRVSGYLLESALQAGLSAAGVDVFLAGPIPTPAVAYLTRALRLQAGVVISASHNPFEDNGIKFFSETGSKLPDDVESAIEAGMNDPIRTMPSLHLGRARRMSDAPGRYIEFCKSTFPFDLDLRGLRIVVDCAHGATYHIARNVFHELGADVSAIGVSPDGLNINRECGATEPGALLQEVLDQKADLGIAFDGDGDRVVMIDGEGVIYDGDQLLYVIACHRKHNGALNGGIVGTAMTNLGVEHALKNSGIPFERAKVGDRYVLEMLQKRDWQIGGEGSGHIICLDRHTTGDGIVSALQVLHAMRQENMTLSELTSGLALYPQILVNVRVAKKFEFEKSEAIAAAKNAAERDLQGAGRVLLRASGTEPLIRVMVEGRSMDRVRFWADSIAKAVQDAAG